MALVALVVAPWPAGAATVIHVDRGQGDCRDSGPGTAATPLCTISAGAARAVAGDIVLVASGTYSEQVSVNRSGAAGQPIVFRAANGASVTVRGGTNGFRVASESWITLRGFNVADTIGHGINVTNSSRITIAGNHVTGAGRPVVGETARGISLATTTGSLVEHNGTHRNTDTGIFLGTGSTGNQVRENSSSNNAREVARAAAGIDVRAASNEVTRNVVSDNEDSGINIWDGAHGSYVSNNVSFRNGDHGIDNKASSNTRILSNTVYLSVDSGIEVVGSTGVTLANNISVNNGVDSPRTEGNVRVDSTSAPSLSLDYDLVYLSQPGVMFDFAGDEYASLAAFRAATGRERHGLDAAPMFRSGVSGDLHLRAGSPAIDSANSGVAGHPATDAERKPRVDAPHTPNTGVGPRTFDDRGAYEFQPK